MATSPSWTEVSSNPSIASAADSPARTSRRPENEPASRALARAFGLNSPALLGFFDRDSFSLRTSQACLFETQCPEWSESWPDSGMWDCGSVYELATSVPAISESGCSLWPGVRADPKPGERLDGTGGKSLDVRARAWPTASASIANDGETAESWKARQQRNIEKHYNGNGMGTPLTIAASTWPTPNVPNGGRTTSTSNYDANGNKRQIDLGATAKHWLTPKTITGGSQAERITLGGGIRKLEDLAEWWQTPATDSFRSRGGDRVNEMGLDQQAWFFPTPSARDWKSETGLENRTEQHAPNLSQFIYLASLPAPQMPDGPPSCENGPTWPRHWLTPTVAVTRGFDQRDVTITDGMGQRSVGQHNLNEQISAMTQGTGPRRLNPRFVEWLMGFPIGWTELSKQP